MLQTKRVESGISSGQNVPTLLGSSFKEFSIKDTFEGTGKSLKVEWILGDNDLVCVCVCVCVCACTGVCIFACLLW